MAIYTSGFRFSTSPATPPTRINDQSTSIQRHNYPTCMTRWRSTRLDSYFDHPATQLPNLSDQVAIYAPGFIFPTSPSNPELGSTTSQRASRPANERPTTQLPNLYDEVAIHTSGFIFYRSPPPTRINDQSTNIQRHNCPTCMTRWRSTLLGPLTSHSESTDNQRHINGHPTGCRCPPTPPQLGSTTGQRASNDTITQLV